jgi:uncharacterized tellurite resistance protein B-like protein
MHDRLRDLYQQVSVDATADREHEAVVELLLLVMIADRRVSPDELDEIRAIAEDQGFESDTFSFDQHVGEAMAHVRQALETPDGVETLLDSIDQRVTSSVLRSSLVAAARAVADADESHSPAEQSVLERITRRFGDAR